MMNYLYIIIKTMYTPYFRSLDLKFINLNIFPLATPFSLPKSKNPLLDPHPPETALYR